MIKDGLTKEDVVHQQGGVVHQKGGVVHPHGEENLKEDLHDEEVALGDEGEDHQDYVLEEDLLYVVEDLNLISWGEEVLSFSWDQQTLHP